VNELIDWKNAIQEFGVINIEYSGRRFQPPNPAGKSPYSGRKLSGFFSDGFLPTACAFW